MLSFIYITLYVASRFCLGSILGTLRSLQIAIEVGFFFLLLLFEIGEVQYSV